jgi:bifunctional non-homologous end joining protein LigD
VTGREEQREIEVAGRTIKVSRPEKVLFPGDDGITKADVVDHYVRVADLMLRHVRDRPVAMKRYPNGIRGQVFYQKQVPAYFPGWIPRIKVRTEQKGTQEHVVIGDAATLAYLAEQACIEPHPWLSRADELDRPDQVVFDLDPSADDLRLVRDCARAVREILEEVGLAAYIKTSGSKGFHVTVPLDRGADFETVRAFARGVAAVVAARDPDRFTTEQRKANRRGRVYLDVMRNGYGQTAIPPYAIRGLPGAPVATPVEWDELGRVKPQSFTIRNLFRRMSRREDPWSNMARHARSLSGPRDRLAKLRQ